MLPQIRSESEAIGRLELSDGMFSLVTDSSEEQSERDRIEAERRSIPDWKLSRLAKFIESEFRSEQDKVELAPAVLRELAKRVARAPKADTAALRKAYGFILRKMRQEFNADERQRICGASGSYALRLVPSFIRDLSIVFYSTQSLQIRLIKILDRMGHAIEAGAVLQPSRLSFATNAVVKAIDTPAALLITLNRVPCVFSVLHN